MDQPQLETTLKQILIKNSVFPIKSISDGDSLAEDLGFDSLAFLVTVSDLEEGLSFAFPVEKVNDLKTLSFGDLVRIVRAELTPQEVAS